VSKASQLRARLRCSDRIWDWIPWQGDSEIGKGMEAYGQKLRSKATAAEVYKRRVRYGKDC